MKKIRFGIVGLGVQGSSYVLYFFDGGHIENAEITALCDCDEKRIEGLKARTKQKNVQYFTDYKEMLDSGLCDAVLIETPHYLHPEIAIECFKRNIHVICEKPAGVYAKQVREMNEAAKNSQSKFAIMFNQRTNCVYRKMREMVQAGELGKLQRVVWIITEWFRTQRYYDSGTWRATWDGEGGGVLINQCPHQLDLVQWVVGELPKKVRGFCQYGKWHDIEVEDDVTAYFEYENGATGIFITTTGEAPGENIFEISGTKGRLVCKNDKLFFYKNAEDTEQYSYTTDEFDKHPACECIEVETDGSNTQWAGIINNFANALLGKEEFFVDGTEGIRGVELMNAIEYSGWFGGKEVVMPVDEEEYLCELNKRRATSRKKKANENASDQGTYGSIRK